MSLRTLLIEVLLAIAFAAVAGGIAYALSQLQSPQHATTVTWAARPNVAGTDLDLDAYEAAVGDEQVLSRALRDLGEEEPGPGNVSRLRRAVDLVVGENESDRATIRLRMTGATPELARERAEAVAASLETWHETTSTERVAGAVQEIDRQVDALTRRIRSLQVFGTEEEGGGTDTLLAERAELLERGRTAAALAESEDPLVTLERSSTTTVQTRPRTTRNVALAASAAILISAGLGWRRPSQHERSGARRGIKKLRLLAAFPSASSESAPSLRDAASHLGSRLMSEAGPARPAVFLITGLAERIGTTMVASRLAEGLARTGTRTLLVDGNLWAPALAERYGVREAADGGTTTLQWLQNPSGVHHVLTLSLNDVTLDLVPQFRSTRPAPGMADALFSGFHEAVRRWGSYDAVVVDAAPILTVQDTRLLAQYVTGTALVIDEHEAESRRLAEARKLLEKSGVPLFGIVTNVASASSPDEQGSPPGVRRPSRGAAEVAVRRVRRQDGS